MADVQFNEDQEFVRSGVLPEQSFFVRLVLKTGLAQTKRGAEYILLSVAGVCILIAVFVFMSAGNSASSVQKFKEGQNVFMPPAAVPAR